MGFKEIVKIFYVVFLMKLIKNFNKFINKKYNCIDAYSAKRFDRI